MIEVAEALIAARGLANVSLRDVQREAGQRNKSAAQYHFGTRDGLLIAIVETRMTPVNAARNARLDQIEAAAESELRPLDAHEIVAAFIEPLADTVSAPRSCYARFLAQVVADPHAAALIVDHLAASSTRRTEALLAAIQEQHGIPALLHAERFARLVLVTVATLAGWEGDATPRGIQRPALVADLVDTAVGLVTAPVSSVTRHLLTAQHDQEPSMTRSPA